MIWIKCIENFEIKTRSLPHFAVNVLYCYSLFFLQSNILCILTARPLTHISIHLKLASMRNEMCKRPWKSSNLLAEHAHRRRMGACAQHVITEFPPAEDRFDSVCLICSANFIPEHCWCDTMGLSHWRYDTGWMYIAWVYLRFKWLSMCVIYVMQTAVSATNLLSRKATSDQLIISGSTFRCNWVQAPHSSQNHTIKYIFNTRYYI